MECKRILPYSCQFCPYVGYDPNGFQKHLQCKPSCEQFYKEKQVTTGEIIDFSSGKVKNTFATPNETSYHYNRFFPSGEQDTVQLNLANDTIANMDYKSKLASLNKTMNTTTNASGYISTSRIISSIRNEIHPIDHSIQSNIGNTNNENAESIADEREEGDIFNNNGIILDNEEHTHLVGASTLDITEEQSKMNKRFSEMTFTHTEEACIDLFHLLKTSNVPLVMFDRIIRWLKRHESGICDNGISGIMNRNNFINSMNQKLYGSSISMMKPKLKPTVLSSGRTSNVVVFSIKEMILKMVTNKSLFHPDNLLLDPTNPCGDVLDDGYYGDVNTGTWFAEAKARECTLPNHILMPFCHFIDGLSVDKYGKLSVEAVLSCCLW